LQRRPWYDSLMGWTLTHGNTTVARLELRNTDMPWFICDMHREPGFEEFEPLFVEQERLMDAENWDGAEALWKRMHSTLKVVDDDEAQPPIDEYLLRICGNEAHLRY
jgi:hypothetical protein